MKASTQSVGHAPQQGATGISHDLQNNLHRLVSMENWPFTQSGISSGDILVTDQMLVDMLSETAAFEQVQLLTPDTVNSDIFESGIRVFVLCLSGELAFVRNAQRRYPDAEVISVSYGENGSTIDLASLAANGLDVTVLVSSPGSGSGYFQDLVTANKLVDSNVMMTPAEVLWAKCQMDFNLMRWGAAKLTGLKGHICVDIDLDLIANLDLRGLLPAKDFKTFLIAADARLVFMTRRIKADQVALIETGSRPTAVEPDVDASLSLAFEIIGAETRCENIFGTLPYFRTVTFEELAESPTEVIKMLTAFFERPALRDILVTDPAVYLNKAGWKAGFRDKFREAAVRLLAISKNEHGSYQTRTEQLLSGRDN